MKKSSDLAIMLKNKSINDTEARKLTNSNVQTPFNRTHVRHPIKEYFPSKITTGLSIQTQSSIKSPPNSKPISLANAISMLSKDETNLNSRRNSRRLHTNQLKNILGKDFEKVSIDTVRFNTQFQNQQPLLHIFTHHNSPKKSLKTSPDTKQMIIQESFRNRISHKLSGHMCDKIELSQQPSESVRQRISNLKSKLRGNIQQRQFKLNNFTNHNTFKEDIEFKFQKPSKPTLPQPASIVLESFALQLSEYEKSEIKDYETIYYLRPEDVKPHEEGEFNFGFDNDKGDYKFRKNDHIIYRYELLEQLGHGSFGYVFKATDHKHQQQQVALKIIKNKEKFHRQALIEIEILKVVNKADNSCCLIKLLNYFIFRNHVCMVFELLSCNLYEFLAINDFQGFELDLVRRFAIQMLQALLYLSECNIIHCDLKPENILLKDINRSGIKIIDFGSSCFVNSKLYTYIQSRFYRAPEILLGIPYSTAIDMWSFGCIVAELFLGNSLFQSKSEKELIFLQVAIVGKPSIQFIDSCPKKNKFFNPNYELITKVKDIELLVQLKPLKELLQNSSSQFQDFIAKCLQWDPNIRLKAAEALLHPWILEGLPQEIKKQHVQQMRYYVQQKNLDQLGQPIK